MPFREGVNENRFSVLLGQVIPPLAQDSILFLIRWRFLAHDYRGVMLGVLTL